VYLRKSEVMKFFGFILSIFFVFSAHAQQLNRDFDFKINGSIVIKNLHGRVHVSAEEAQESKVSLKVDSQKALADNELSISNKDGKIQIAVAPQNPKTRVDLTLKIPLRSRVRVETRDGEVRIAGNVESADVTTETGTISTDVPLDSLKYNFLWTASRPRYLSDATLESEVKEKAGGRFVLNGKLGEAAKKKEREKGKKGEGETEESASSDEETSDEQTSTDEKEKSDKQKKSKEQKALEEKLVSLNFTTDRGIVLLNVNPAEVPSNLQERPLTEAAKAIIRSGDSLLMDAIRRSSPKYFGDYLKTLPPRRREPSLT
jgi:osmotically-inducible protein OsmY